MQEHSDTLETFLSLHALQEGLRHYRGRLLSLAPVRPESVMLSLSLLCNGLRPAGGSLGAPLATLLWNLKMAQASIPGNSATGQPSFMTPPLRGCQLLCVSSLLHCLRTLVQAH